MATRKKSKKATPKKKRYSTSLDGSKSNVTCKTVYKNSDDLYGTIKFIDEEVESNRTIKEIFKENLESVAQYKLHIKLKNAKDRRKLRFADSELNILEKALHSCVVTKIDFDHLKFLLAWANTAFKDKDYSYEENLREAGRRLGFTKGGASLKTLMPYSIPSKGKKRKYDPLEVTDMYKKLIETGIDRKDAVRKLADNFSFASLDACSRYLRKNGLENIPNIRKSSARHK